MPSNQNPVIDKNDLADALARVARDLAAGLADVAIGAGRPNHTLAGIAGDAPDGLPGVHAHRLRLGFLAANQQHAADCRRGEQGRTGEAGR